VAKVNIRKSTQAATIFKRIAHTTNPDTTISPTIQQRTRLGIPLCSKAFLGQFQFYLQSGDTSSLGVSHWGSLWNFELFACGEFGWHTIIGGERRGEDMYIKKDRKDTLTSKKSTADGDKIVCAC